MRKSKISASEMEERELTEYNRLHKRGRALNLARVRDRGWVRLKNNVVMLWPVDKELGKTVSTITLEDGEKLTVTTYPPYVPDGHFTLEIDGKRHMFDTDEFRKFLRWA